MDYKSTIQKVRKLTNNTEFNKMTKKYKPLETIWPMKSENTQFNLNNINPSYVLIYIIPRFDLYQLNGITIDVPDKYIRSVELSIAGQLYDNIPRRLFDYIRKMYGYSDNTIPFYLGNKLPIGDLQYHEIRLKIIFASEIRNAGIQQFNITTYYRFAKHLENKKHIHWGYNISRDLIDNNNNIRIDGLNYGLFLYKPNIIDFNVIIMEIDDNYSVEFDDAEQISPDTYYLNFPVGIAFSRIAKVLCFTNVNGQKVPLLFEEYHGLRGNLYMISSGMFGKRFAA